MTRYILLTLCTLIPLSLAAGSATLVLVGFFDKDYGFLESSLLVGLGSMGLVFGSFLLQGFFRK